MRRYKRRRPIVYRASQSSVRGVKSSSVSVALSLKKDFSRQLRAFVGKLSEGGHAKVRLPLAREHAFTKRGGKPLKDVSLRKKHRMVEYSDTSPGEMTVHTHNSLKVVNSSSPSLVDLSTFLELNHLDGKSFAAIIVFDLGPDYSLFLKKASKAKKAFLKSGRKPISPKEAHAILKGGNKAVDGFRVSGKVFLYPTKEFLGIGADSRIKIINSINKHIFLRDGGTPSIHDSALLKSLIDEYGPLYRLRYSPSRGYRHDPGQGAFVKA